MKVYTSPDKRITIANADALESYNEWKTPTVIISDGPYGLNSFPGDLVTPKKLGEWYEPHIRTWSEKATPNTTLWFWNTELGWATVHPILIKYGWEFVNCHFWDKGLGHIAGNTNTKKLHKLPVVTEVCVQYAKAPRFNVEAKQVSAKEWLIYEWTRTKLPFSKTNLAAGVKNAATRKYFTKCHLWYSPPAEIFEKIVAYANIYGENSGKPYFTVDNIILTKKEWEAMRPKFKCPIGVTNVWRLPQLKGKERLKLGTKALHLNQKPLSLMKLIIELSSEPDDVVWEPFGGLATAIIAAYDLKRKGYAAEINPQTFNFAVDRIKKHVSDKQ